VGLSGRGNRIDWGSLGKARKRKEGTRGRQELLQKPCRVSFEGGEREKRMPQEVGRGG